MEVAVFILMIMVCMSLLLRYTFSHMVVSIVAAVVAALFVVVMWPYAIEQSRSQIADWLSSPSLMRDTAVLIYIDIAMSMGFCIMSVACLASSCKRWVVILWQILRYFPGVMIFMVLFSLLVTTIFNSPGADFITVAVGVALSVSLAIPVGVWGLNRLLPEFDIRLEFLFLLNALMAMLGVVVTVNGSTATSGVDKVDWIATAAVMLLSVGGALFGLVLWRLHRRRFVLTNSEK